MSQNIGNGDHPLRAWNPNIIPIGIHGVPVQSSSLKIISRPMTSKDPQVSLLPQPKEISTLTLGQGMSQNDNRKPLCALNPNVLPKTTHSPAALIRQSYQNFGTSPLSLKVNRITTVRRDPKIIVLSQPPNVTPTIALQSSKMVRGQGISPNSNRKAELNLNLAAKAPHNSLQDSTSSENKIRTVRPNIIFLSQPRKIVPNTALQSPKIVLSQGTCPNPKRKCELNLNVEARPCHSPTLFTKNVLQQDQELLRARQRADEAMTSHYEYERETRKQSSLLPTIFEDDEVLEDEALDIIDLAEDSDGPEEPDLSSDDEDGNDPKGDESGDSDDSTFSDDFVMKKKKRPSLSLKQKKQSPKPNVDRSKVKDNSAEDKIMEILPSDYLYVVESSEITSGEKYDNIRATVRVNVTTAEEANKWLNSFELSSKTNFRFKKTLNTKESQRVVFKKKYRCHHNTLAEKSKSKNPHEKHIKCPAELTITVNNPGMRWNKDPHLKSHPCKIMIKHVHNHSTTNAFGDVLRHRRPCAQVVETFTQMFTDEKQRITPVQAMEIHVSNLENNDPNRHSLGDGALCPEMSWLYKLYHKIMKRRCGEPYGPDMIAALQRNIDEYNLECKDLCAKMGSTSDERHHYVAICSPMMKRILTHHKTSAEVMFIDSSSNMDNCNARIFVILTASVVCGLPEGLLITFSESEDIITAALKLWKEIIPTNAFYGRGLRGPKVILSDDSAAERNSLRITFPEAILLLCIFHVLQAMWRYIWDSHHMVKFEDKPYIYYLFRQLVYAPSVDDFNSLYEDVLEDEKMKSYALVLDHIKDLFHRAKEWALCLRNDLILRGHNTNNLSEVVMKIMKDCLLVRVRAYNTVQLFNLLSNGLDNYYKRKLALVVNNRIRSSRSRLRVDPAKLKPLAAEKLFSSDHLFRVKNTEKNTVYIVDTELEICSCPVGKCGAPCKHQLAVVKEFNISHQQFLPTNDAAFKMVLYYIMSGETTAPDVFFNTLKGEEVAVAPIVVETPTSDINDQAIQEDQVDIPLTSDQSAKSMREKIDAMAEDLLEKVSGSSDYLADPLDKFLKTYWTISKK